MFPIVKAGYTSAREKLAFAGRAELVKGGRADVRFSIDADASELYLYSKGDGIIRRSGEA